MLVVDDVSIAYGERTVLSGVSLNVAAGEIVALVGPNGVGKSSLGRAMCGMRLAAGGRIAVDDVDPADGQDARDAVRGLVGYVFQDPADQIVSTLVYDEVAFGPRNLGLSEDEVAARVSEALMLAEIPGVEMRDVGDLSGGELARVALAGVLAMHPRYLVLDEVLAQLDPHLRPRLRALFSALAHQEGVGVIGITHDSADIAAADRIVDLSSCRSPKFPIVQTTGIVGHLEKQQVDDLKFSAEKEDFKKKYRDCRTFENEGAALVARGVSYAYEPRLKRCDDGARRMKLVLDGVDLELHRGQAVLLAGPSGAGKSTLAYLLAGLYEPQAGSVALVSGSRGAMLQGSCAPGAAPHPDASSSTHAEHSVSVRPGMVGLAFQSPEAQLFCDTVYDEVAFGPRNVGLTEDAVRERVLRACAALGIEGEMLQAYPFELSGGWQRRVGLAGVIALDAAAYVFDEPTAGLDAQGREELHALVRGLRDAGRAVLIISHDIDEWEPLVDRTFTLRDGRLAAGLAEDMPAAKSSDASEMAGGNSESASAALPGAVGCAGAASGQTPLLAALNARVKLAWYIGLTVALFAAPGAWGIAVALVLLAACMRVDGIAPQGLARMAKPAVAVLVLTLLANAVRVDGTAAIAVAGPLGIDPAGGVRGALAVARIVILVGYALVIAASTTPQQVSDAVVRLLRPLSRLGVPAGALGTALALALRFIPLIMAEYDRLRMAQRARGAIFDEGPLLARIKLHLAILIPLIAGLMRRADNLADAMAARLYSPRGAVSVAKAPLHPLDRAALAILALVLAACLLLR